MSATFYDLLKFAKTGIAAPSMTHYDKMKALSMCKAGFPVKTISGVPPISFQSDGTPLTAWSITGNMTQTGTPTPTAPIQPEECGDLVESGEHTGEYAVPITVAGQTQTVYLSEPIRKIGDYADVASAVGTVGTATRQIKKLVLTGEETWGYGAAYNTAYAQWPDDHMYDNSDIILCSTHYAAQLQVTSSARVSDKTAAFNANDRTLYIRDTTYSNSTDFKAFLSEQYAASTPVTIWYVLANPVTETVTAPTITPQKGANTLTVGTTLPPSEVSITGGIK